MPLSLAHSDGAPLKTDKAALTKTLGRRQEVILVDASLPLIAATVIDGGIILHETVLQHSKSTYATMARDLLAKVCLCRGEEVHLVLDKYQTQSIKDAERNLRRSTTSQVFIITGPDQAQRQSGTELHKMGRSKKSLPGLSWRNGKSPNMGQFLEGKLCTFHMVVCACG